MEHLERHEIETIVDNASEPIDGSDPFGSFTRMISTPEAIEPLRHIKEAIAEIEDLNECDCGQPGCVSSTPHSKIIGDSIQSTLDGLKAMRDELREQTIALFEEMLNCKCADCQLRGKLQSAPFN